ncbi:MAG: hypothetical protein AAFX99_05860, partial [Myxococcota bacterium]
GQIIIGGRFSYVSGVPVSNVAAWTGTDWASLGEGVDINIQAMAIDDSDTLYVGGRANGGFIGFGPNFVYAWDMDQGWRTLGPELEPGAMVSALELDAQGTLHAAIAADGEQGRVTQLARWNPDDGQWINLTVQGVDGDVEDIAFDAEGNACVSGLFTAVDGVSAQSIACWNGTAWEAVGDGFNSILYAMHLYDDGRILVGGGQSLNIGTPEEPDFVVGLSLWDGQAWVPFEGGGVSGGSVTEVRSLVVEEDRILVGGSFSSAGTVAAVNIAQYAQGAWSGLEPGLVNQVNVVLVDGVDAILAEEDGGFVAGGRFSRAGQTLQANNVVRWTGAAWENLVDPGKTLIGVSGHVMAFTTALDGQTLYIGGDFTDLGSDGAVGVAQYTPGGDFLSVGNSGDVFSSGGVSALTMAPDGVLYAGGSFSNAFASYQDGVWSPSLSAPDGPISALSACPDGSVVAVGDFISAVTVTLNQIGLWNGTAWEPLGSGLEGNDFAFLQAVHCAAADDIWVAGSFEVIGGETISNIARWNGEGFVPVADVDGEVTALTAHDGSIYIGGSFTRVDDVPAWGIARWSDGAWQAVGGGLTTSFDFSPPSVASITVKSNGLFVVGRFERAWDNPDDVRFDDEEAPYVEAYHVAWYDFEDEAWYGLDMGLNDLATAGIVYDNSLFVGGFFSAAGGLPSLGMARWSYAP